MEPNNTDQPITENTVSTDTNTPSVTQNPPQVTTDTNISASNEAKTDIQPQIASEVVIAEKKEHPGQPTKYNAEMLKKAKDYLEMSLKNRNLPLIEELSRICEVDSDTINNWCDEYEEFFGTIKRIKELQKERIILKGFSAKNPTFAIFMLKANHGMIETEKKLLGNENKNEPLQVSVAQYIATTPLQETNG